MLEEIAIRINPPTAGVGVLCIDGGGARGVIPLKILKRIQDRINLPMPIQRFFQAAFGISSGKSFSAITFHTDNSRWTDRPIYIR
jgi:patatin-like phospholipase/acyl hydrolase